MHNSQMLASWRRQRAWISAALLFAADAKLSANPLRTSLWDLHPLICEFAGKHSNIVLFLCSVCRIQCLDSVCKLKHYPFASGGSANTSGFSWREFAHRWPTLQRSGASNRQQRRVSGPKRTLAGTSPPDSKRKRRKMVCCYYYCYSCTCLRIPAYLSDSTSTSSFFLFFVAPSFPV